MWSKILSLFHCWPDCKPEGPLFSADVCLSVCLCVWVCLWPALLPFNVDRFWWNLVTRTLLWSSVAVATPFWKFIKILKNHRIRISKFWSIKLDSIWTKLTEEIHFEVCPYRHNASMDATPPSNAMCPLQAPHARCKHQRAAACPYHSGRPHLLPARYDLGALQRGTFKNSTLGVFINSEWSVFGNSGSGHVRNSELGTTFVGHSELGAFGPGGAIGL